MNSTKFANVPVEPDTTIIFETQAGIDDLQVLWQKWVWQDIQADSLIFAVEDVADMSDEALLELVQSTAVPHAGTEFTLKRGPNFVFVNMNFSDQATRFS